MKISTDQEFDLSSLFEGNLDSEQIKNISELFGSIEKSELFKPIV